MSAVAVRSSPWPIAGLLLLGALPLTFGALRLLQFAGLVAVMPPVPGGFHAAAPLVLHIGGAAVYAILGALQFSATIRRRWPAWHRAAGKVALAGGLIVALSALWLTANYATASAGGLLLVAFRVAFAAGLLAALLLGLVAIRRRDVQRHSEWMTRAYALGLGAATQMLVLMAADVAMGTPPGELGRALLMGLAWALNLALAEWLIRRRRSPGPGLAVTAAIASRVP
jgi:hypothetical protein